MEGHLSRRLSFYKQHQALALSLGLHAALLSLLFISFVQPGTPSGQANLVVPITLVSAASLPDLPSPALSNAALATAETVSPMATAQGDDGDEAALLLNTRTSLDIMAAALKQHAAREAAAASQASVLPHTVEDIPVLVTNAKKQNTQGESFIIAITITPAQAAIELIPASAAYSFP